jgi:hypothetical protein
VVVRAANMRPVRKRAADGRDLGRDPSTQQIMPSRGTRIVVEQTIEGGRIRRQDATGAVLRVPRASAVDASSAGPLASAAGPDAAERARIAFTLDLFEVSAREADETGELIIPEGDEAAVGAMSEWTINQLTLADDPARKLLEQSTWKLIDEAGARAAARPADREVIAPALAELNRKVGDLLREAFSKQQERFAMAAACLVMVLIGGVMAMRLRDSLPLTIYLWAFFPAIAAVISINAGQQLTHGYGPAGLLLLWGGVAALAAYAVVEFTKLARH